ncbi:MAG: biotin carboxyl carrier domain-containing protein [Alphaproteobacteria bacterium]|jgi:biotin carboxyl carrier protein|nr:biotin carboxyl carrier domain-containing protein [Alphaproteobacteria bacterium]MDA7634918.1 acetyl-CoA carboxylase [Alphaproteobacteria bacterium]MDG2467591.1 acetyl-CoA carboxylase [Alphaproteobacteria bacterium]
MSDIQSPLPGTFYFTPSPGEPSFKSAGDSVSEGDVIGLIEVMKTFIEVKATEAGTFESYEIGNEQPVQAGQVIAKLK